MHLRALPFLTTVDATERRFLVKTQRVWWNRKAVEPVMTRCACAWLKTATRTAPRAGKKSEPINLRPQSSPSAMRPHVPPRPGTRGVMTLGAPGRSSSRVLSAVLYVRPRSCRGYRNRGAKTWRIRQKHVEASVQRPAASLPEGKKVVRRRTERDGCPLDHRRPVLSEMRAGAFVGALLHAPSCRRKRAEGRQRGVLSQGSPAADR